MSLTLLLDLDDTLLDNGMEVFLPAYFQALSKHIEPLVNPAQFIDCLLAATARMIDNDRPDRTLLEIFNASFYSGLGVAPEMLEPAILSFYQQVFPDLRQHTRQLPAAKDLINTAGKRGYTVAIATNPLFPRTAIDQRLDWSGVCSVQYPFDLVSAMESFHFAKPNPAYFAELLAQLGWPDSPAIVVGDDPKNDIEPARTLGLPTFHVRKNGMAAEPTEADGTGELGAFLPWLDHTDPESLTTGFTSPAGLLSVLASTAAALDTNIGRAARGRLDWKPAPAEWSVTEVLCHLRDVEAEVQFPRLQNIIQEENPFISAENTDLWAAARNYAAQDGRMALSTFMASRTSTLALLSGLEEEAWDRPARHAIFGPTTLRELVLFMAEHDRLHIRQIHKLRADADMP